MITKRLDMEKVREQLLTEGWEKPELCLVGPAGTVTATMPLTPMFLNAKVPEHHSLQVRGSVDGEEEILILRDKRGPVAVYCSWPETYLHVEHCRSGEEWIKPITPRQRLDLIARLKEWIREEYGGAFRLDEKPTPRLPGDYYAQILTHGRDPYGAVCWTSGGFSLKEAN